MIDDGKVMPLSGGSVALQFLLSVFVLLPTLCALLPMVVGYFILKMIKDKVFGSPKDVKIATSSENPAEEHKTPSKSDRPFDLVGSFTNI